MPRIYTFPQGFLPALLFSALAICSVGPAHAAAEPHWIRVSSTHFSVLTDAGEKKGREVTLRFEQMRSVFAQLLLKTRVNLPHPLEIIAVNSDEEYVRLAPFRQGRPISAPGFFLTGEDRNYIVLDLFADDSWQAVTHPFAHLLLNYNYPPTPGWFDEGFAEYFSSIRLDNKQVQIGGDPELNAPWQDAPGNQSGVSGPKKSVPEMLHGPSWLPMSDLLTQKHDAWVYQEETHHTLFFAQSWIVVHYLINKNKLSETGNYFELVQNQKLPVEQAIQQAYGLTAAQFEQAVKDYLLTLAPLLQAQPVAKQPNTTNPGGQAYEFPSPIDSNTFGTSTQPVTDSEARALLAEVAARLPEHREQALKDLDSIIAEPKTESAIAHRALAWAHMEKQEYDQATEELSTAMELNANDPWVRYYLALVKYHAAQASGQSFHGLSNMMQDLRAVLDWNPEFAEAYSMLAMARVEGGGINSAMEAMRAAIQLSPRNENYQMNMATIYIAGKKWDAATALLEHLKSSQSPQIAQAARKNLEDLPTLKKYGFLPQSTGASPPPKEATSAATQPRPRPPAPKPDTQEDDETGDQPPAAEPQPDKRPVKFLKTKIVSVDCSQAPAAVLTVTSGAKTIKLRTENYKSLLLIGTDEFSCDWKDRPASANYKAGGKADGDLVSLELQ